MSKGCATNIVPLLARLVLGIAFTYHGLGKLSSQKYSGPEADKLVELGMEADEGVVNGKGLHAVAIMLHDRNADFPKPIPMAWIAALTELIGGALIFFGFFSRIWGLGLAVTMGMAFYVTTVPQVCAIDKPFFKLIGDTDAISNILQTGAGYQLGMFVLALGVALTGPGACSIDRMLFSRRGGHGKGDEVTLT